MSLIVLRRAAWAFLKSSRRKVQAPVGKGPVTVLPHCLITYWGALTLASTIVSSYQWRVRQSLPCAIGPLYFQFVNFSGRSQTKVQHQIILRTIDSRRSLHPGVVESSRWSGKQHCLSHPSGSSSLHLPPIAARANVPFVAPRCAKLPAWSRRY